MSDPVLHCDIPLCSARFSSSERACVPKIPTCRLRLYQYHCGAVDPVRSLCIGLNDSVPDTMPECPMAVLTALNRDCIRPRRPERRRQFRSGSVPDPTGTAVRSGKCRIVDKAWTLFSSVFACFCEFSLFSPCLHVVVKAVIYAVKRNSTQQEERCTAP